MMVTLRRISPDTAKTYKDVRLRALGDAPLAFGSTYAKESALTDPDAPFPIRTIPRFSSLRWNVRPELEHTPLIGKLPKA